MTKQDALNKLYNIYNSMGEDTPLNTKNELWWVILDLKASNKAYFKSFILFDLLKDYFNIKITYSEYIIRI